MREILFRGKRLDGGEFIEGDLVHGVSDKVFISYDEAYAVTDCCGEHIETDRFVEVDPATVGQFTGRCDKNGKRIFEGDVLEVFEHAQVRQLWYVGFKHGCFVASLDKLENFNVMFNRISFGQVEVIGNIHDKQAKEARR